VAAAAPKMPKSGISSRFSAAATTAEARVANMTILWCPVMARTRPAGPTEELKSWAAAMTTITGQPQTNSAPKNAMMSRASRAVSRKNAKAPVKAQRDTSLYR
jgi:hypothetical protein